MQYKYNDNTLIHSIGFNLSKLESIMKYGILSLKKAKELGLNIARNYDGYNLDNGISMTRFLYINPCIQDTAYVKYTTNGISFIVEDISFHSDTDIEKRIHRADEVIVDAYIPRENIKGMIIPEEYRELTLDKLQYLALGSKNTNNIINTCENIIQFLKGYGYYITPLNYNIYMKYKSLLDNLIVASKALIDYAKNGIGEENIDYKESVTDYYDIQNDLNDFFAEGISHCFNSYFNKEVTLYEVVEFINNKYLKLPVYDLPFVKRNVNRGR